MAVGRVRKRSLKDYFTFHPCLINAHRERGWAEIDLLPLPTLKPACFILKNNVCGLGHMNDTFGFEGKFLLLPWKKLEESIFPSNLSRELHFLKAKEKKKYFPSRDLSPFLSAISHLGLFFPCMNQTRPVTKGRDGTRLSGSRALVGGSPHEES